MTPNETPGQPFRVILAPASVANTACDVGQERNDTCQVLAYQEPGGGPAARVAVRFQVLEGPLAFTPARAAEVVLQTDDGGKAAPGVLFTGVGAALVAAELVDDPRQVLFFALHSEKTTHTLSLDYRPTVSASRGLVTARIVAVDHHGAPVTGARLEFIGTRRIDTQVEGEVTELGGGEYEGRFRTHLAGEWKLLATDADTRVEASGCFHVLPGRPSRIEPLGTTDPRHAPPYNELPLLARLVDRYGNPLDPHRIRCTAGGRDLPSEAILGGAARFPVRYPGNGTVEVHLADRESPVSTHLNVAFAAAWLASPGVVFAETAFRTALYVLPEAGRPFTRGTVEVSFDPELASFSGLETPPPGGPPLTASASVAGSTITISVQSETPISAEAYPQGIPVAEIAWGCKGPGQACFNVSARLSPKKPGWELCVAQKRLDEKCLCINIVYQDGDTRAMIRGEVLAGAIGVAISANLDQCCPSLTVELKTCSVSKDDWKAVQRVGKVSGGAKFGRVRRIVSDCLKDKCINFIMVPLAPDLMGITHRENGVVALDPEKSWTDGTLTSPYTGAHEAGHALGLDDDHDDPDNLMYFEDDKPEARKLTPEQCRKIWENLDKYACAK